VAQALYKEIILDHPGSLFGVEARKRFRALRGDGMTKEEEFFEGIEPDQP